MTGVRVKVTLPRLLAEGVDALVARGDYLDHGEVIRDALRRLLERTVPP